MLSSQKGLVLRDLAIIKFSHPPTGFVDSAQQTRILGL